MLFTTIPTSKINTNVYAVRTGFVNFYIYKDETATICFDTGVGKSRIQKELRKLSIPATEVSHIFLTHSDKDHINGVQLFPNAQVYISVLEEPLIKGEIKRSPLTRNSQIAREYNTLADGEIISIESIAVKAISTPGHTIGSMSFLVNNHILFTGDTIDLKRNKATTGKNFINMDSAVQGASIKKIATLENISLLCTCHTGISDNFRAAMQEWI